MSDTTTTRLSPSICTAFVTILLTGCGHSTHDSVKPKDAQVTMECERYRVKEGRKIDRTIFTIAFSPGRDHLSFQKTSGPDWIIPNTSDLRLIWKSKDQLRFVAKWVDARYEVDDKVWHPVMIFDFDFSSLRYSVKTVGGFSDFDEIISDSWKCECRRLD